MNATTEAKPHQPKLSDGRNVLFGWVLDSEKGVALVCAPSLDAGALLALIDEARGQVAARWRKGIQDKIIQTGKEQEQRRIIVPNGVLD